MFFEQLITHNLTNISDNETKLEEALVFDLREGLIVVFLGSMILCAIIGNTLVILAVASNKRLRTVTNYFVVSLAVADLLVASLVMPLSVVVEVTHRWWFGIYICDIWTSSDVMLCTASILNLCCISLDRYFAITNPLVYATKRTKKLALIMIGVVWVASVVITCPPIFGWQEPGRGNDTSQCVLSSDPGYVAYSACGSFFVPLIVMLYVYYRIFRVANEREKRLRPLRRGPARRAYHVRFKQDTDGGACKSISEGDSSEEIKDTCLAENENNSPTVTPPTSNLKRQSPTRTSARPLLQRHKSFNQSRLYFFKTKDETKNERAILLRERKAAKTLAVVLGGFVICWLPFFLIYIIKPFCSTCWIHATVETFFTWLGYFNSAINPFIYAFYNQDFRSSFWRLTCGRCFRKRSHS